MEFPDLGEADLVAELQYVHRTPRRALDTALYGVGASTALVADLPQGRVAFRVVPARSELELRRALVKRDETPVVALVSYDASELPLDLAARLAHGEVRHVSSEARLRRRFHVSWIHPDVRALRPLCDALLEGTSSALPPGAAQLDADSAWRLVLAAWCGLSAEAAFTLRRLLVHLATVTPSPRWTDWMTAHPELRAPFDAWLARGVDDIAPALWSAWEEGLGARVGALTFLLGPLGEAVTTEALFRIQARAWVERVSAPLAARVSDVPRGFARWGECEKPLHDALLHAHPRALDAALREADARVADAAREPALRVALAASEHLALAWEESADALAAALTTALATPTRDTHAAAVSALARMERHRNARGDAQSVVRSRAALRLIGWRAARPDLAHLRAEGASWQVATELARDYVQQGGFADLCRRHVRGSHDGALGRALAAVEAEADRLRDDDDQRFAVSLRAWVEHGRREEQVTPIERALDTFAVPFLRDSAPRRLLVILLDGSSWSTTLELLFDLEDHHRHHVMRWQPTRGAGFVLPVMAALPTVTEVSRAAFFAGRAMEPGERADTSLDPRRFAEHKGLRAVLSAAPTLRLEPDVQTASGHASPEALSMVRSEQRVVAVVLNAIDDQLHGSPQLDVRYTVDAIKPLQALLAAAREAGRAVLFASDHGHVTGARLRSVGARKEGDGGRARVLHEGEAAGPGEVVFHGAGVWTPRKGQRVALRARETETLGAAAVNGQHGGVTLSEVVAPAVFVVSESLRDARVELHDDATLDPRPLPRPPWWDLQWSAPAQRPVARPEPTPTQPSLPSLEPPPPAKAAAPPVTAPRVIAAPAPVASSPLGRALLAAETFRALPEDRRKRLAAQVVPMVDLLVAHGGQMSLAAMARGMSEVTGRAEQLAIAASEILNLDGVPVLSCDVVADLVRLDVDALRDLIDYREG